MGLDVIELFVGLVEALVNAGDIGCGSGQLGLLDFELVHLLGELSCADPQFSDLLVGGLEPGGHFLAEVGGFMRGCLMVDFSRGELFCDSGILRCEILDRECELGYGVSVL